MKVVVGLERDGAIALGVACDDCGGVHQLTAMTPHETLTLIAQLQAMVAISGRIRALPLPYTSDVGTA